MANDMDRWLRRLNLVLPVPPLHAVEGFLGAGGDALLEDELDVLDVADGLARVSVDNEEVGVLTDLDRADGAVAAEVGGAVEGRDADGFHGGEAGLDEEF